MKDMAAMQTDEELALYLKGATECYFVQLWLGKLSFQQYLEFCRDAYQAALDHIEAQLGWDLYEQGGKP